MKVVVWNMHFGGTTETWRYLAELEPDLALLQECKVPPEFASTYKVIYQTAMTSKGRPQRWGSAVLVHKKFESKHVLFESVSSPLTADVLTKLGGCFVAADVVSDLGKIRVVSCHSPAWKIPCDQFGVHESLIQELQDQVNDKELFGADFLWKYLKNEMVAGNSYIVGGDFNTSVLFDDTWGSGNQALIDRMNSLGLVECVRKYFPDPRSSPTFKNKGGEVIHQIDYLWLTPNLSGMTSQCSIGDREILSQKLSDHLPIISRIAA